MAGLVTSMVKSKNFMQWLYKLYSHQWSYNLYDHCFEAFTFHHRGHLYGNFVLYDNSMTAADGFRAHMPIHTSSIGTMKCTTKYTVPNGTESFRPYFKHFQVVNIFLLFFFIKYKVSIFSVPIFKKIAHHDFKIYLNGTLQFFS